MCQASARKLRLPGSIPWHAQRQEEVGGLCQLPWLCSSELIGGGTAVSHVHWVRALPQACSACRCWFEGRAGHASAGGCITRVSLSAAALLPCLLCVLGMLI